MGNKCSCLYNKEDETNTAYFQEQGLTSSISVLKNNLVENEQYTSMSKRKPLLVEHLNKDYKQFVKQQAESKILTKGIIKLQSICIAFKFRKKLLKSKLEELRLEEEKLVNEYVEKFTSDKLKSAESAFGKFNPESWMAYLEKIRKGSLKSNPLQSSTLICLDSVKNESKTFPKTIIPTKDSLYIGDSNIDRKKHGFGVLLQENGTQWTGTWIENIFSGFGRYIDKDGNLFEGIWDNFALTGKGNFQSLNGKVFRGDFVKSLKEGKGIEENEDYIYEGSFKNDLREGRGKLTYKKKNEFYDGEFCENLIHGEGTYTWSDKSNYSGTWFMGKMHGKGTYKWPNGGEYCGDYQNNLKHGFGKWTFPDGKIFEGPIQNGLPHGIGNLIFKGKVKEVEFIQGNCNKNYKKPKITNLTTEKIVQEIDKLQNDKNF